MNCKIVQISDRTDLSTESGSGPIQLARDRYRVARRSVADSPPHCMNVQKIVSYYTRSVKKAAKLNILFTVRRLKARPSARATSPHALLQGATAVPPGEFNGIIEDPLHVYSKSFMTTVLTVFP